MSKVKLYLVGDKTAEDNNSWLAMTSELTKAAELMETIPEACTMKILELDSKEEHNARS